MRSRALRLVGEPPELLPEHQLAYVAGVIDAIGNIRVRVVRGSADLPLVTVSSTNWDMLRYLGRITGVGVTKVTRDYNRAICSSHCPQPHAHIMSVTGRWSISGARAVILLEAVLPFMHLRRQAAIEMIASGRAISSKPASWVKMRELGWPVNDPPSDL